MARVCCMSMREERKKGSSATSRTPMFYSYFLFSNTEKLIQRRRFSKQEPYTHMARCLPHTEWEYAPCTRSNRSVCDVCACLSFARSLILFYFHLFRFGVVFSSFIVFYFGNSVDTFCLFVSCVYSSHLARHKIIKFYMAVRYPDPTQMVGMCIVTLYIVHILFSFTYVSIRWPIELSSYNQAPDLVDDVICRATEY